MADEKFPYQTSTKEGNEKIAEGLLNLQQVGRYLIFTFRGCDFSLSESGDYVGQTLQSMDALVNKLKHEGYANNGAFIQFACASISGEYEEANFLGQTCDFEIKDENFSPICGGLPVRPTEGDRSALILGFDPSLNEASVDEFIKAIVKSISELKIPNFSFQKTDVAEDWILEAIDNTTYSYGSRGESRDRPIVLNRMIKEILGEGSQVSEIVKEEITGVAPCHQLERYVEARGIPKAYYTAAIEVLGQVFLGLPGYEGLLDEEPNVVIEARREIQHELSTLLQDLKCEEKTILVKTGPEKTDYVKVDSMSALMALRDLIHYRKSRQSSNENPIFTHLRNMAELLPEDEDTKKAAYLSECLRAFIQIVVEKSSVMPPASALTSRGLRYSETQVSPEMDGGMGLLP